MPRHATFGTQISHQTIRKLEKNSCGTGHRESPWKTAGWEITSWMNLAGFPGKCPLQHLAVDAVLTTASPTFGWHETDEIWPTYEMFAKSTNLAKQRNSAAKARKAPGSKHVRDPTQLAELKRWWTRRVVDLVDPDLPDLPELDSWLHRTLAAREIWLKLRWNSQTQPAPNGAHRCDSRCVSCSGEALADSCASKCTTDATGAGGKPSEPTSISIDDILRTYSDYVAVAMVSQAQWQALQNLKATKATKVQHVEQLTNCTGLGNFSFKFGGSLEVRISMLFAQTRLRTHMICKI